MQRYKYCPGCGKEKKFDCKCEYGSLMKINMEPNEKQRGLFHKKYCPKCGSAATKMTCNQCGFNFSEDDFWIAKLW